MIPDLTSRPIHKPRPFSALTHGQLHWAWLKAGTLRLDLRALKSQNPIFFLRIPFYTVQSYHNYKNPVGRIDTLICTCLCDCKQLLTETVMIDTFHEKANARH